jgi:RNA polymerase sigma factor (sigma-70 family)
MDGGATFSDAALLGNLRTGQQMNESIKSIYRDHYELLSRYILSNNGSAQDAEDIFQDVVISFIDLVRKNKFRGDSSIRTFLFAMNKNTWLNELKRKDRAARREAGYDQLQDATLTDISHVIAGREASQELLKVISRLGDGCKKILLLFYYETLPYKEIVEQTGYENEQVVRNKKYKCLKQLEQLISTDPVSMQTLKKLFHG